MSLKLTIDAVGWRSWTSEFARANPDCIPVIKGNGYGYGRELLAAEAVRLGANTVAVGLFSEVESLRAGGWTGDIIVCEPWRQGIEVTDPGVIVTISTLEDLANVAVTNPQQRVTVELLTSMKRFGIDPKTLATQRMLLSAARVVSWSIHLPMRQGVGDVLPIAKYALGIEKLPLWVSHLSAGQVERLSDHTGVPVRLRVGTRLWLGAPKTRRVTATVQEVHQVAAGERVGYWQHRLPGKGWLVVVSAGTSHGVAMSAPTAASSARKRLISVATGLSEGMGRARSPFTIAGKKREFAEPPHMHSSLVFVPGKRPCEIGDEVTVEVRLTTVSVDEVILNLPADQNQASAP